VQQAQDSLAVGIAHTHTQTKEEEEEEGLCAENNVGGLPYDGDWMVRCHIVVMQAKSVNMMAA
jgi:hypothetical protein